MTDEPLPKRIRIDFEELTTLSREELIDKIQEQDFYVRTLEKTRARSSDAGDEEDGRGPEEKLKQQNMEAARRENTLVLRLTNKEQELQDCLNQISEMKQAQTQSTAQLRSMLLDPALNLVFQRMGKEVDESKEKLKQTQNELSAWKFTPDSQTGKRLMAKCRMLLQENEELGKMIASGRTAKLEGEIALQKTLVQEMKKNQEELDDFVGELEEDVEGMQSMIYVLQTQLKETKDLVTRLQAENDQLKTSQYAHPQNIVDSGKNVVNHMSVSPKPEASSITDDMTVHLKQEPADLVVKAPSPSGRDLNHTCPQSSVADCEAMETDSSEQVNCSERTETGDQTPCDSGEAKWSTPINLDRTTAAAANNHGVHPHILSADSTSCQETHTDTSNDGWSPRNSNTDDNGSAATAGEAISLTMDKTTLNDESDAQTATTDSKPVRNGVEKVTTQQESEEEAI